MLEHSTNVEGVSIIIALLTKEIEDEDHTISCEVYAEAEMVAKTFARQDAYQVRIRHIGGEKHGLLKSESEWAYTASSAAYAWLDETGDVCYYNPKQIAMLASDAYLGRLA